MTRYTSSFEKSTPNETQPQLFVHFFGWNNICPGSVLWYHFAAGVMFWFLYGEGVGWNGNLVRVKV